MGKKLHFLTWKCLNTLSYLLNHEILILYLGPLGIFHKSLLEASIRISMIFNSFSLVIKS